MHRGEGKEVFVQSADTSKAEAGQQWLQWRFFGARKVFVLWAGRDEALVGLFACFYLLWSLDCAATVS